MSSASSEPAPVEWISVTEAARRLGMSSSRVRDYVRSGRLAALAPGSAQNPGRGYLVDASAVAEFEPGAPGRPRGAVTAPVLAGRPSPAAGAPAGGQVGAPAGFVAEATYLWAVADLERERDAHAATRVELEHARAELLRLRSELEAAYEAAEAATAGLAGLVGSRRRQVQADTMRDLERP